MSSFHLYVADCLGNEKNCLYPHAVEVRDEASLTSAVSSDYVAVEYRGSYRSTDRFVSSDCLALDCDNDHSEDPSRWMTPDGIRENIPDVTVGFHFSRHHMLPKDGKSARPRFHCFFYMEPMSSAAEYSYSFAGLSDIYESFMMDMAGAAEIPATKLFGRSPQGFNSTGESDLRNYYDMIAQMQERLLRPALEKLLQVMAISCWGYVPEDLEIVFEPVMTTSPAERAELVQKISSDVIQAFQAGIISREEAREELKTRGEELGAYAKIEPAEDKILADPG